MIYYDLVIAAGAGLTFSSILLFFPGSSAEGIQRPSFLMLNYLSRDGGIWLPVSLGGGAFMAGGPNARSHSGRNRDLGIQAVESFRTRDAHSGPFGGWLLS